MDVKRLENIRDFVINEVSSDNFYMYENYSNEKLDILYVEGDDFLTILIKNFVYGEYEMEDVLTFSEVFKCFDDFAYRIENENLLISFDIEYVDFKLLNRKRKLWMLKD